MAKRYDIVIPRKYDDKNGDEKTQWNKVGTLVWFPATESKPDGFKLEMPIFGHDKFKVFEQKPRNASKTPYTESSDPDDAYPTPTTENASNGDVEGSKVGISEDEIPF